MKKPIYLSLACLMLLQAEEIELDSININTTITTEVIKDVSGEDIKSADLADALFKQSASISLSRRSGIANDITVRGQRKDNINVTIDGAKVCGACPNRMDPPISHVLTNNVDYIEINEGPFSVEDFGVLTADIKIHTKKPEKKFQGEVNFGLGSFGYQKSAFSLSGGTDNLRFLLSGSTEKGGQYEDGDGDDFVGQIQREIANGTVPAATQYQTKYQGMDAFEKKTLMAKMFWNITDNQELRFSYTANRSDNILYPSSKMDALYDDSDIFNIEYIGKNFGAYSKELTLQAYQSEVKHPMSTIYRTVGATNYMTHTLTTEVQGAKIKNSFDIANHIITTGLDYSIRNWDGKYYRNNIPHVPQFNSIWNVDTTNKAIFISDKINMDKLIVDIGLRYDNTEITSGDITQQSNDYNELNGFLMATYNANETTKYFAGVGKSSRVPDGKELYWLGSTGSSIGTPNLTNTINYEFDIGVEKHLENSTIKAKFFYSKLKDYIAYNSNNAANKYENVDATVYGFDLSGSYMATDSIYFDYGMAYQRGKKDNPLTGQTDTNLPDISPFKFNGAINYEYNDSLLLRAEVVFADKWDSFDGDNGEQELDAYGVINLKATKTFGDNFELIVGVDNLFDKTYAVSNTYNDLILLSTGTDVMLLNEPGRYFYTNLKYKF